jgi:hypothetical protein
VYFISVGEGSKGIAGATGGSGDGVCGDGSELWIVYGSREGVGGIPFIGAYAREFHVGEVSRCEEDQGKV